MDESRTASVHEGKACRRCGLPLRVVSTDQGLAGVMGGFPVLASRYECPNGHGYRDVLVGNLMRLAAVDLVPDDSES